MSDNPNKEVTGPEVTAEETGGTGVTDVAEVTGVTGVAEVTGVSEAAEVGKGKKKRKPKKQKPVYIDDGHTVYGMENLPSVARKKKKDEGVNVTKKERRAMIKAAYLYYLPRLLLGIACFAGVAVLLWLWLK